MALNISQTLREIAFVDSPQYIVVQSDTLTTELFSLKLDVWHGLKGSPVTLRTLTAKAIDDGASKRGVFEVSNYIANELEIDVIPTDFGTAHYNEKAGCWFQFTVTADAFQEAVISNTSFCTYGVGEYADLVNPGTTIAAENGKAFGNFSTKLIASTVMDYVLPIYIGDSSINNEISSNIGDFDLIDFTGGLLDQNSLDSANQIGYFAIGISSYGVNWIDGFNLEFEVFGGTQEYYKIMVKQYQCSTKSFKYLNQSGAIAEIPLNGSALETLVAKKTTFNNLTLVSNGTGVSYDTNKHVKKTFTVSGTRNILIDMGWTFEESNQMVEELMLSKYVWYINEGVTTPISITDRAMKVINRKYVRQIGYKFTVEVANDQLNKVL